MSTQDKWTNKYNDKEFADKLAGVTLKFEDTKYKGYNERNIKDSEIRSIQSQIINARRIIQRLDNHKNELKPLLAEAYKKYKTVLIETLDFWNSQEWFEIVKNELELEDKAERDLKILERLVKLAFDCDKEKESFKDYNTTALKVEQLTRQIERFEFLFNLLVKKKEKENQFLIEEFGKYEPAIIEVLDYWKAELIKLQSGNDTQSNIELKTKHQPKNKSQFSVLEWATIYYYADTTKLLPENRIISERMKEFMIKHEVNTTFDNFKTTYYEAKKRINEKNDYPINKLELIIPFLKVNYNQTVTKVENDIIFLEENKPEY